MGKKTKRSGDSVLMTMDDVYVYTAGESKVAFFDKDVDGDDADNKAWLSSEKAYHTRDWR